MAYVGIDTQGARALANALRDTAAATEAVRQQAVGALQLVDLTGQAPMRLALAHDGLAALGAGVAEKADLAEQFTVDPQQAAARLGVPADELGLALGAVVGLGGPAGLRDILVGLPAPGTDPALDAALVRLKPVLLPPPGQKPPEATAPDAATLADLRRLAVGLGIEFAGPSRAPGGTPVATGHGGTEVFWNDFWADGRTPAQVFDNPQQLLAWVNGTLELDRRLAVAPRLPGLDDILTTHDFMTARSDPAALEAALAAARTEFAAIDGWLPAFLVGLDATGPDATQLAQTLAFAARVGWVDPGPERAGGPARFAEAVAFLRANRFLQSSLLPTRFGGDPDPVAFLNAPGIELILELGRRTGVVDDALRARLDAVVARIVPPGPPNPTGPTGPTGPGLAVDLPEALQRTIFGLVASQLPPAAAQSPAVQAQFVAALGYLRQAADTTELRRRIVDVVAAFRTLGVTGAPALTERQLTGIVGPDVLRVLGRTRLRLRDEAYIRKHPEFLLVARLWGVPGGHKEVIGKYKYTWSFDDRGELTGIRLKKRSTLSRIVDTIKSVGKAIWASWKENPFKAIFQVGKLALSVASLVVPGLQALGAASLALNLAEAGYHAVRGDWLAAIGAGLAAFTAGAGDVFGVGRTLLAGAQNTLVTDLLEPSLFDFVKDAKRAFDIGTAIVNVTKADSLAGGIAAGLGAAASVLGSGGQLLASAGAATAGEVSSLVRLGTTARDLGRLVAPAVGLVQAAQRGDGLVAAGNGLAVVAEGARALANPLGTFTDPRVSIVDKSAVEDLRVVATGAGIVSGLAGAGAAARGQRVLQAASSLARVAEAVNDPFQADPTNPLRVLRRSLDVADAIEVGVDRIAPPAAIAPLVLARLGIALDTAAARPPGTRATRATPAVAGLAPAGG